MPSTFSLFFSASKDLLSVVDFFANLSVFIKCRESHRSAKILALAVSEGYKNFSCESHQTNFDWPGLNQVSIPGPINTEGSRSMCYCSWRDLDHMPVSGPSDGLCLVEKWSLKAN